MNNLIIHPWSIFYMSHPNYWNLVVFTTLESSFITIVWHSFWNFYNNQNNPFKQHTWIVCLNSVSSKNTSTISSLSSVNKTNLKKIFIQQFPLETYFQRINMRCQDIPVMTNNTQHYLPILFLSIRGCLTHCATNLCPWAVLHLFRRPIKHILLFPPLISNQNSGVRLEATMNNWVLLCDNSVMSFREKPLEGLFWILWQSLAA